MEQNKQALCQYSAAPAFESSIGRLCIFLPTHTGYIQYNIVHTYKESIYADIWRLGQAFAVDDALENAYEITPSGAEWDMALRITGRDDFIGGYAHGDEIFVSLSLWLDGQPREITSLRERTPFRELRITEASIGYDPDDHVTQALRHEKDYRIDRDGIILHQKVEWLHHYTLGSSYMAMMPPKKTLTDSYDTDVQDAPAPILTNRFSVPNSTKAAVFGTTTSNLRFEMHVPKYPQLPGGSKFYVTDNNNGRYNKMYFVACNGAEVSCGDVWETTTCYRIING